MTAMPVSGKTTVCGVIGDPIEHTMSPAMHNAAFSALDLDFVYVAFRVAAGELGRAIAGMKALEIKGLSVTIPHKVAVIPSMDRIDPLAEKIGAVNTIVNEGGALTGYNTDAMGFLRALIEHGTEPRGKKVLLLGAGGAAHAISYILTEEGAHLVILNRKEEFSWAQDLAARLGRSYEIPVGVGELNRGAIEQAIGDSDILVNATSVGMSPNAGQSPVPADLLCSGLLVFDAVYNPFETRLLREAKEAGAETIDGLEMLVWQGALAFEKFTGHEAPVDVMRAAALKVLRREK